MKKLTPEQEQDLRDEAREELPMMLFILSPLILYALAYVVRWVVSL